MVRDFFIPDQKMALCLDLFPIIALSTRSPCTDMTLQQNKTEHGKAAIVLALFGSTVQSGLRGIYGVEAALRQAFPATSISLAFTSNQVRGIWQERAKSSEYRFLHPEIRDSILQIQGPLAAIANLQDRGYRDIVVQPGHIVAAEEYHDLASYVRNLALIRTMKPRWQPFKRLVLAKPALGAYNPRHSYSADILTAAEALIADVNLAREREAILVYMGHGNLYFPAGGLYLECAARMRSLAPDTPTFIGTVEGFPGIDEVLVELRRQPCKRVLLKPFLLCAGDHAHRDMAGDAPDSWKSILTREGFTVEAIARGLGEEPEFAALFARHTASAAADAGIELL